MLLHWIWLTTRRGLSNRGVLKVLAQFQSPEQAFYADHTQLQMAADLTNRERDALADKSLEEPKRILELCSRKSVHFLTCQDAAYPERLRNIDNPPAFLYYKGTLPAVDTEPVIGMVGTRKGTLFGFSVGRRLGYQIAACGGVVVSGIAEGGDAMCMIGAVTASQPVIGVLGGGIDVIYPASNRSLYEDVQRYGCLISEYPPGTPAFGGHFPERNRIISGLALGVVVTEAPLRSGALITAHHAFEQGRDVFAVPGALNQETYAGCNHLLKEGAFVAETGWDVMKEYYHLYPEKIKKTMLGADLALVIDELREHAEPYMPRVAERVATPRPQVAAKAPQQEYIDPDAISSELLEDERDVLHALKSGTCTVDELVESIQKKTPAILSALTLLEVKGFVERLPANRFSLAKKIK